MMINHVVMIAVLVCTVITSATVRADRSADVEADKVPANDVAQLTPKTYIVPYGSVGCSGSYLEGKNTPAFYANNPYAEFRPRPFYDHHDVNRAAQREPPFLIAGLNCDRTLARAKTITGVTLEDLSLRARGTPTYGSYFERKSKEWSGIGCVHLRTSSEGFLSRNFLYRVDESTADRTKASGEMRRQLLTDNELVRRQGLTHQLVAEPMLTAIAAYIQSGKREFEINGVQFSLVEKGMGGAVDLLSHETDEEFRRRSSGWIGKGVQGSPFNDELFANKLFVFKKKNGDQQLIIDGLTPHLIYRYGFYQGGQYRTDPKTIKEFFNLRPPAVDPWRTCAEPG